MPRLLPLILLLLPRIVLGEEATPIDLSEGGTFAQQLVHMLLSLTFVLAILVVGAWILKKVLNQRMLQGNSESDIKILERRALSPKSAVYLLEVRGRRLLVGETPVGLSALGDLTKDGDSETFEQILGES